MAACGRWPERGAGQGGVARGLPPQGSHPRVLEASHGAVRQGRVAALTQQVPGRSELLALVGQVVPRPGPVAGRKNVRVLFFTLCRDPGEQGGGQGGPATAVCGPLAVGGPAGLLHAQEWLHGAPLGQWLGQEEGREGDVRARGVSLSGAVASVFLGLASEPGGVWRSWALAMAGARVLVVCHPVPLVRRDVGPGPPVVQAGQVGAPPQQSLGSPGLLAPAERAVPCPGSVAGGWGARVLFLLLPCGPGERGGECRGSWPGCLPQRCLGPASLPRGLGARWWRPRSVGPQCRALWLGCPVRTGRRGTSVCVIPGHGKAEGEVV